MTYAADPGGVFDSDVHRRVLGHLSPDEKFGLDALAIRLGPDQHTPLGAEDGGELEEVLRDLEASGLAKEYADGGWGLQKKGLDALNAPVGGE